MTSHVGRLYALALALVVLFATWTAVATRPWAATATTTDPRVAALVAREQRLRHESLVVRRLVQRRWAVYRVQLGKRQRQIAAVHRQQLAVNRQAAAAAQRAQAAAAAQAQAAPSFTAAAPAVQVVNLPPLTVTRTS